MHFCEGETLNISEWLARAGFKKTDVIRMQTDVMIHLQRQWRLYRESVQTYMEENDCIDPTEFQISHPYRVPQISDQLSVV
ncbi:MAG: hypothetical protein AAF378_00320 [Cyanobacteria bacterium P01_A01_bin.84]